MMSTQTTSDNQRQTKLKIIRSDRTSAYLYQIFVSLSHPHVINSADLHLICLKNASCKLAFLFFGTKHSP